MMIDKGIAGHIKVKLGKMVVSHEACDYCFPSSQRKTIRKYPPRPPRRRGENYFVKDSFRVIIQATLFKGGG